MTTNQFATLKSIYQIIIDAASLTFSEVASLLFSVAASFFLLISLYLVVVFFHHYVSVVVAATVFFFYISSIAWLCIFERLFCKFHLHLRIPWKQCFIRMFSYRYNFCAALLTVYGLSYAFLQFLAFLAYFVFIASVMSIAYVGSGMSLIPALKKAPRLAWQHLFECILTFFPPIGCLMLSVFLYNYILPHLKNSWILAALLLICIWIAITIVWLLASALVLQNKLDPDSVDLQPVYFQPQQKEDS